MASNNAEARTAYLKKAFDKYDRDKNGSLHTGELVVVLKDLGLRVSLEDVKKKLAEYDTTKSGNIDFEEFVVLLQRCKRERDQIFVDKLSKEQLSEYEKYFGEHDTDRTGTLKLSDVTAVCKDLGLEGSDDVDFMRMLLAKFDIDGDDTIAFNEFVVMVSQIKASIEMTSVVKNLTEEQLAQYRAEFDKADADKNGVLTKSELWDIMEKKGVKFSFNNFLEKFREVDINQSGSVDFNEFVYMLEKNKKSF